jgi:Domain of unknown function (DUF4926)
MGEMAIYKQIFEMTTNNIKLLDVVALTTDLPEENLWRSQVGTVVEILADGAVFEVEFSDKEGQTHESLGLYPEQLMVLYFNPVSPNLQPEIITA